MYRKLTAIMLLSAVGLIRPSQAGHAGNNIDEEDCTPLRRVPGVRVGVDKIHRDADKLGLNEIEIAADVAARLRKAGIKVGGPQYPLLRIRGRIASRERYPHVVAYSVDVRLEEDAHLCRTPGEDQPAVTWESGEVGLLKPAEVRRVRDAIQSHVGAFITAWRQANSTK